MTYDAPRRGREATPHWTAARAGTLMLPFDAQSGEPVWPPGAAAMEWRACDGAGTVLAFSVVRRPVQPEWRDKAPYVVAMVALDTGHWLFSNVIGCDPADVRIGARVRCTFVETTELRARPASLHARVSRAGRLAAGGKYADAAMSSNCLGNSVACCCPGLFCRAYRTRVQRDVSNDIVGSLGR